MNNYTVIILAVNGEPYIWNPVIVRSSNLEFCKSRAEKLFSQKGIDSVAVIDQHDNVIHLLDNGVAI